MSSTTYSAVNVDGDVMRYTRTVKQGRPKKDDDLKRVHRVTVNLTAAEFQRLQDNAAGMDLQQFAQIALSCYTVSCCK